MNAQVGVSILEDKVEFVEKCLDYMGMESTPWRVDFLLTWMQGESTKALWNPFATTMNVPQEDRDNNYFFNHNGGNPVKNYANCDAGVRATVRTMQLSYYTNIIASLRQERIVNKQQVLKEFKTWSSTDHYHIANLIRQGWTPTGRGVVSTSTKKKLNKRDAKKNARDIAVQGIPLATFLTIALSLQPQIITYLGDNPALLGGAALPFATTIFRLIRSYLGKAPEND